MARQFVPRPAEDDEEDDYRAQVDRYPRLSSDEEGRLLAAPAREREAANRTLIEHNLYLVWEAAAERKERGVPFGDLFQEGTVGLISAVEHYQPAQGPFHARLTQVIAATMDDVIAQTQEAQRNDEAFVAACRALEAADRLLSARLGRDATSTELARLLHWDEARVNLVLDILHKAQQVHDEELIDYLDDALDGQDSNGS